MTSVHTQEGVKGSKLLQLARSRAEKKKNEESQSESIRPSKLAMLARGGKEHGEILGYLNDASTGMDHTVEDHESNESNESNENPQSIDSKLRAQNNDFSPETVSESPSPPSVSILDRLSLSNKPSKPSLSNLARHRNATSISILDKISPQTTKPSTAKLANLVQKRTNFVRKPISVPKPEQVKSLSPPKAPVDDFQTLSFDISTKSNLLETTVSKLSDFLFKPAKRAPSYETSKLKRLKHSDIFRPYTNLELEKAIKVEENFSKPSPDDLISEAQRGAFEEKMANLHIKKKPEEKPVKKTTPNKKFDLKHELSTNPTYMKPHKSFVVIGHVDAGKSTLMGRMLYDFGIVDARTVNKLVKEAEKAGKGSFALAWIMDQTSEERSHGVTVDICATDFETDKTRFTAIDAPGHKDFVPQMIGGVSQADFALLVVDSITGEFEAGFAMDGQTKEHTILAKNLGIEKICVAVNKMDKEEWNEARYEAIKAQLQEYLSSEEVGFLPEQIDCIPISGLSGNNVVKRDRSIAAFEWYTGPTLGEYLEHVKLTTDLTSDSVTNLLSEDFFVSVHDSNRDKGELKVSGKISSGVIQVGETILAEPSGETLQVQGLSVALKKVDFAIRGELVQMSFKANQLENDSIDALRIGDLICKVGSTARTVKKLTVSLHLFNMTKPLLVGTPFVMFRNNCQVPARISKLIEVIGGKKKKKLLHLVSKQTAVVEIEIQGTSVPITKYSDNKNLGRIVIRREGVTVGAGMVIDFE